MTAVNGDIITSRDVPTTRLKTFFTNKAFAHPDGGRVETEAFLHACQILLPIFDCWGTAFKFIKYDLKGNMDSVRKVYETDMVRFKYLNDMLECDAKAHTRSCAEPLLWLKRGLRFIQIFLEILSRDLKNKEGQENLIPILDECYKATVKRYHSWMLQKLVMLSWKATPWRRDLVKVLCNGKAENHEILIEDIESFLVNMKLILDHLDDVYQKFSLDSNKKSTSLKQGS